MICFCSYDTITITVQRSVILLGFHNEIITVKHLETRIEYEGEMLQLYYDTTMGRINLKQQRTFLGEHVA